MVRREVPMPEELVNEIRAIVAREGYTALAQAFPPDAGQPVFLSQAEAEALITLAVIEKKKAWLKFPYYDDDHPNYDAAHAAGFDDVQMGIYEKTIYYVESAFKQGGFDHLL